MASRAPLRTRSRIASTATTLPSTARCTGVAPDAAIALAFSRERAPRRSPPTRATAPSPPRPRARRRVLARPRPAPQRTRSPAPPQCLARAPPRGSPSRSDARSPPRPPPPARAPSPRRARASRFHPPRLALGHRPRLVEHHGVDRPAARSSASPLLTSTPRVAPRPMPYHQRRRRREPHRARARDDRHRHEAISACTSCGSGPSRHHTPNAGRPP